MLAVVRDDLRVATGADDGVVLKTVPASEAP